MFESYKWAIAVRAAKTTTVKAYGCKAKVQGLCEDSSVNGTARFVLANPTKLTVTMPPVEVSEHLSLSAKITDVAQEDVAKLVLGLMPDAKLPNLDADEDKDKDTSSKPKGKGKRGGVDPALNGSTSTADAGV
jgi:hypothetical protein